MRFNENDNYLDVAVRDRIRFLLFISWWTVFFCSIYGILFALSSSNALISVASHGVL